MKQIAPMLPPGMHYARAKGTTVTRLHGTGPWSLTYVDPSDDPSTTTR